MRRVGLSRMGGAWAWLIAACAGLSVIFGAILQGHDVMSLVRGRDPAPPAASAPPPPVLAPTGSEARLRAELDALVGTCPGLALTAVELARRDTPAGEASHPFDAVYLEATLTATREGADLGLSAAGSGKGPGAEGRAEGALIESARTALADMAPDCFDRG